MSRLLNLGDRHVSTFMKAGVLLFALVLGGCLTTKTTTLEPQNRALSPDKARIYFMRIDAPEYKLTTAPLKVDSLEVGELANHSFLFVDRPPGQHTIGVRMPIEPTVAYTFEAAAGHSYYFVVNFKTIRHPVFVGYYTGSYFEITNTVGKIVGEIPPFGLAYWGQVDERVGASMIAEMKSP